jgi:hypothetical protein
MYIFTTHFCNNKVLVYFTIVTFGEIVNSVFVCTCVCVCVCSYVFCF